ncbi:hypothetical protein FO519_006845 [Halicephalobus sp. NKZ332]|nr:hypothetical protein FO519_006845 [Halicephalobus sp. NKZ332]
MNRFLTPSLVNRTTGYLGDDSGSKSLSYKAALLQVLQRNASFPFEMDYSGEDDSFQSSGNLDPDHTHSQKEHSGTMNPEEYTEGEGELDMLIGYFIMNLICIVFFLMFGMCVICSCMRRRPKLFRAKSQEPEKSPGTKMFSFKKASTPKMNFVAPPPITTPGLKPTFKAIVSKAIASDEFKKLAENGKIEDPEAGHPRRCSGVGLNPDEKARLLRRGSEYLKRRDDIQIEMEANQEPLRCKSVTNDVQIQTESSEPSNPEQEQEQEQEPVPNGDVKTQDSKLCSSCHPDKQLDPNHICDCDCKAEKVEEGSSEDDSDSEQPSVVRQNLLGPLSFDDLYYT